MSSLVHTEVEGAIAHLTLNDPERRNALGHAMFDALTEAIHDMGARADVSVMLLRGAGKAFCAGFDLAAAADDPSLMGAYIHRLSAICRELRRMAPVVVASVQGAAIAGGCAMVSACDLVVVAPSAKLGYPVHAIGVSPAVTIPTLGASIGDGHARTLLMSGAIIDGAEALRIGLATHRAATDEGVHDEALALCSTLAAHGPHALRTTKAWLNELDGSLDDARFDGPATGSAQICDGDEAATMLRAFWARRRP